MGGLAEVLHGDEAMVQALLCHQFAVTASFHDAALIEHNDFIGVANGTQPVGYDQTRPTLHQAADGLLDLLL